MRLRLIGAVLAGCGGLNLQAQAVRLEPAEQLVREVVYNELHDHAHHGAWRYWVTQGAGGASRLEEQVETGDGPVARVVAAGGRPLSGAALWSEQQRLDRLAHSSEEAERCHRSYTEDEQRMGRILALLPDAFAYEEGGEHDGMRELYFHPRADFPAHTVEARIFHAMSGTLWIDERFKRLRRLDGKLEENVDFGYGLLGRLYKGGWFRLERARVSATDWKTVRLEIHMSGRALLLKTIARETSEVRGGFEPVPTGLTLAQGLQMLGPQTGNAAELEAALKVNR